MVYNLFSKRCKEERGEVPDIYTYDKLPDQLRVQITYIFDQVCKLIGRYNSDIYKWVSEILREERGVFELYHSEHYGVYGNTWNYNGEVTGYFLKESNTELALDVVQLFFEVASKLIFNEFEFNSEKFNDSVSKLNIRFKEHGIGYCFANNKIIRIDSELIHKEIIKPTLKLLHDKQFKNAEDEYLKAHEHYRNGRYDECLVDCLKSMESTIKIIGHKRKWKIQESDNISKLIGHVMENELIDKYFQDHFNALQQCLKSGVPTVRNKNGGHGSGIKTEKTQAFMAEYLLGETATTIRLLVSADKV